MTASSSRATRRLEIGGPAITARHSLVTSSVTFRMRKRRDDPAAGGAAVIDFFPLWKWKEGWTVLAVDIHRKGRLAFAEGWATARRRGVSTSRATASEDDGVFGSVPHAMGSAGLGPELGL